MVIVSELGVGRSVEQHVGYCIAGRAMVSAIAVGLPILLCLSKARHRSRSRRAS